MPDERTFRQVMGHFTTGVTVVTSRRPDGDPAGLTANSVASVSLDPTLVLVCLDRSAVTLSSVVEGGAYAINVLPVEAGALARRFAAGDREDRFEGLPVREEVTGCPVLEDALAWLDCRVRDVHDGGDHVIVVGEVVGCGVAGGEPLLFYGGAYRSLGGEVDGGAERPPEAAPGATAGAAAGATADGAAGRTADGAAAQASSGGSVVASLPPFLVGSAAAVAGEVAAGLLLYSGAGFLQALTLVLATLLGALALGLWSAPAPGSDAPGSEAPVERLRRRWLLALVTFVVAGLAAGAWSFLGGLTAGVLARGLGLALLAALPLYGAGSLLGTMAAVHPGRGMRGPGAAAAAGAALGAVFTGIFLVRTVAPVAMYVYCLVALSAGALIHGRVLDRYAR